MTTLSGTVISVSLSTQVPKQSGGLYDAWELVFKANDGKVGSITKPVQGLKFNSALKQALSELKTGDPFTCVMEKNEKGYNEVVSLAKGEYQTAMASTPDAPKAGKVTGSNYETPAERAARQVLIVRQSSLSNALEYFAVSKEKPDVAKVLGLAQNFADFVFNKQDQEVE